MLRSVPPIETFPGTRRWHEASCCLAAACSATGRRSTTAITWSSTPSNGSSIASVTRASCIAPDAASLASVRASATRTIASMVRRCGRRSPSTGRRRHGVGGTVGFRRRRRTRGTTFVLTLPTPSGDAPHLLSDSTLHSENV